MRKEILQRTALSRRQLAKTAAAAGLALVTMPVVMKPAQSAGGVTYLTWSGYELEGFHTPFIEKYGGPPDFAIFANQEEAVQKVNGGFTPDLVHPCSETVIRWRQADLIQPFDLSKIDAWDDIWPDLKGLKNASDDQGNVFFIPWEWGNSSILYRTDMVDVEEESWNMMFDERYAGKISMYNEAAAAVEIAAQALGYTNIFTLDDTQLEEVKKMLVKQREISRFYWNSQSEVEQAMSSGEIVIAYAWNDALLNLTEQGIPVKYAVPKEGIRTWVCGLVHTNVGTADTQAVYDCINSMLSVGSGVSLMTEFGYGHSNSKAFAEVDPAVLESLGIADPTKIMSTSIFLEGEEPPYDQLYIKIYEDVMAGL
ncbi:MAG: extracellular solute-binding protein [Dongiaceae bacterium]